MNNLPDHKPLGQEEFRGLYARGNGYVVPDNFFSDCLNVEYPEKEVRTRRGSELDFAATNIARVFRYKRLGETPRWILLDRSGNLYDSLYPNNPIYTDATFTDFSMVNYNNRAYITPHNRTAGIAGKSVLVYEGSGTARLAAGSAPSGFTLVASNSATSGNCEEGIHIIAVAYITSTGYITAPGPTVFAQVTSTGGKKIDVSSIPVGPASTSSRVILATRSIPVDQFTGNQFGYELYFVPTATIADNVTTTLALSFYDSDLVDSADYLIDNSATIPAGVGLAIYNGRLAVWAANGDEHTLSLSRSGYPETFNGVDGKISIDPSEAVSGIRNVAEYRKNLLVWKSNRTYATSDNGSDPSSWEVNSIDKAAGTECFGVATVLDARGTNNDRLFFADRSGLLCFEGFVKRPELSFNIEEIWKRINKAKFNLVQVVDDPVNHRLYISVPLDSATAISHLLVADYSKAFTVYGTIDEKMFKWAYWQFPSVPISIVGDSDATTFAPNLYIALTAGVYRIKSGLTNDFSNAIDSWIKSDWKTALVGWINHFAGIKARAVGSGTLSVTLYGHNDVATQAVPGLPLNASQGYELFRLINFNDEFCSVRLRCTTINHYFQLNRLEVFAKPLWFTRPG